jgi:hypothetical protein
VSFKGALTAGSDFYQADLLKPKIALKYLAKKLIQWLV